MDAVVQQHVTHNRPNRANSRTRRTRSSVRHGQHSFLSERRDKFTPTKRHNIGTLKCPPPPPTAKEKNTQGKQEPDTEAPRYHNSPFWTVEAYNHNQGNNEYTKSDMRTEKAGSKCVAYSLAILPQAARVIIPRRTIRARHLTP